MNTLIFAAGVALGALATFVFVFISLVIVARKKNDPSKISENLIKELWDEYIKEMKDDGK